MALLTVATPILHPHDNLSLARDERHGALIAKEPTEGQPKPRTDDQAVVEEEDLDFDRLTALELGLKGSLLATLPGKEILSGT